MPVLGQPDTRCCAHAAGNFLTHAGDAGIHPQRTGLSKGRSHGSHPGASRPGLHRFTGGDSPGSGKAILHPHHRPWRALCGGRGPQGRSCRISVVSGAGDILENSSLPTSSGAFEEQELLAVLARCPSRCPRRDFPPGAARFVALGISVLGRVDTEQGVWLSGLQYGPFRNVNVPARFSDLRVPVIVEDHARSVAFGEMRRQGAPRERTLRFSTWVKVWGRPSSWTAGFTGAVTGWRGKSGMWRCRGMTSDASAATPGAWRRWHPEQESFPRFGQESGRALSPRSGSRGGRGDAVPFRHRGGGGGARPPGGAGAPGSGRALGEACSLVMKMVNPPRIIVSGDAAALSESLAEPMNRRIRERAPLEARLDFGTSFARYTENDEAVGVALLSIDKALSDRVAPGPLPEGRHDE